MVPWSFWQGQLLRSPLAFDTETLLVDLSREVPDMVLASASDGNQNVILRPEQVQDFLALHCEHEWVGHNLASFDFWVLHKLLGSFPPRETFRSVVDKFAEAFFARETLWSLIDQHRCHDTMLLEQLVRLGEGRGEFTRDAKAGDDKFFAKGLAQCCKEYGVSVQFEAEEKKTRKSKKGSPPPTVPHRLRYHEIHGVQDWSTCDPKFFSYAAKDVRACWELYGILKTRAEKIYSKIPPGVIYPDALSRYGLLTEQIQIKGALALSRVGKLGFRVDLSRSKPLEESIRKELEPSQLFLMETYPQIFKRNKKGELEMMKSSRLPSLSNKDLKQALAQEAKALGIPCPISQGKVRAVSTEREVWKEYAPRSDFIRHWCAYEKASTLLEYFDMLQEEFLHAEYTPLVRTGRTSAKRRIQQIPKASVFRSLFIPREGYKLLTIDYSGIELRTLAAICLMRIGRSRLAEVFNRPAPYDDAHSFTASMMMGKSFDDFLVEFKKEKKLKEGPHLDARQSAKACNFGIPGGLGIDSLIEYAWTQYGVRMTSEDAARFRHKITREIYPELSDETGYLADSALDDLVINLGLDREEVHDTFRLNFQDFMGAALRSMPKILEGITTKADGSPYHPRWLDNCWNTLLSLARISPSFPPASLPDVQARKGSRELKNLFFQGSAITPTGRVRSGVGYTAAKNSPFQGLAADGAKLGLYNLIRKDFRIVAFIHDEVVVELPTEYASESAPVIHDILRDAMLEVLDNKVPVALEYNPPGDTWSK